MKSNDEISDFYKMQKEFGFLKSIHLSREFVDHGCTEYELNIVLSDYPYRVGDKTMLVTFLGVRNFKMSDIDGLLKCFISVNDVSDHQMEGIHYRIAEEEHGLFSYYCQTFRFEILS